MSEAVEVDTPHFRPTRKRVFVQLIEKEKVTNSGIILTRADPGEVSKGRVLAIGPECVDVKVGEVVLPNWNKALKTSLDGIEFYVVDELEIIMVFDNVDENGDEVTQ
jgi:co-chaperonin GroES (HSP10)